MEPDWADLDDEGFASGDTPAERPYSVRPYSVRPYSVRPYSVRPYSVRPYSVRPYSVRPYSVREDGTRPYSVRPYSVRGKDTALAESGLLDRDEWSGDVGQLVCERSAVLRLGGRLVVAEHELPVGTFPAATGFRAAGAAGPAAAAAVVPPMPIHPGDWKLEANVAVAPGVLRSIGSEPELAYTLKLDLAEALARAADETFLQGAGPVGPMGVAAVVPQTPAGADLLATARALVTDVRTAAPSPPVFRSPGWIFGPATLERLTALTTRNGLVADAGAAAQSLDSLRLLRLDGVDGGRFLGYPFVLSAGAGRNVYFSADWQEAWIGVDPSLVSVHVSTQGPPAAVGPGAVLSATMPLDFAARRLEAFAWSA